MGFGWGKLTKNIYCCVYSISVAYVHNVVYNYIHNVVYTQRCVYATDILYTQRCVYKISELENGTRVSIEVE